MNTESPERIKRYAALLAMAEQLHAAGQSENDIFTAVRNGGGWAIESIKVLRALYGLSLYDAKMRLHASPVWADQVPGWERLHDELEPVAGLLNEPNAEHEP